jgi:hypothetical protein
MRRPPPAESTGKEIALPVRFGFDNDRCLNEQPTAIYPRVGGFEDKLDFEFGGKVLFDMHAWRVPQKLKDPAGEPAFSGKNPFRV